MPPLVASRQARNEKQAKNYFAQILSEQNKKKNISLLHGETINADKIQGRFRSCFHILPSSYE